MITIMMNTFGGRPRLMGEAIQSILDQTYKNWILQITNVHREKLRLVCDDPRIKIFNVPRFEDFSCQQIWSLQRIQTKYWCIVDDDDYILPEHLELLRESMNTATNVLKLDYPRCVSTKYVLYYKDGTYEYRMKTWARCLYEKIDDSIIEDAHKKFMVEGIDQQCFERDIRNLDCWNHLMENRDPTYMYRMDDSFHMVDQHSRHVKLPQVKMETIIPQYYSDLEKNHRDAVEKCRHIYIDK